MKTNATIDQLNQALNTINQKYDNNVVFKRLDKQSKNRVNFTLTVKSSKGKGGRINRICAACWHVHGDFFDTLLKIDSNIFVVSQGNKRIDKNGGNWRDWNIGSQS